MPTKLQTDREFTRSIGIQDDRSICDMCQLLVLSEARAKEAVSVAALVIDGNRKTIAKKTEHVRMWQLATFAAVLMMIAFGWMSLKGGAQ